MWDISWDCGKLGREGAELRLDGMVRRDLIFHWIFGQNVVNCNNACRRLARLL